MSTKPLTVCKNGCYRDCKFTLAGNVIMTSTVAYRCPCDCHSVRKKKTKLTPKNYMLNKWLFVNMRKALKENED